MSRSRSGLKTKSQIVEYHWDMLCKKFAREIAAMEAIKKPYTRKELKEEFLHTCWACEYAPVMTYRCHIKALCEGGSNDSENIHLLCDLCHKESEFFSGEIYDEWFNTRWDLPGPLFDLNLRRAIQMENYYLNGKWHFIPPRVLEFIQGDSMVQSYIKDNGITIQKPLEPHA